MSGLDAGTRREVERALGHSFHDPDLMLAALTHRSAVSARGAYGYERLEFLGDRVLGLCVADMLYRAFADEPEGSLAVRHTELVRKETLAEIASELGFGNFVLLATDAPHLRSRGLQTVLADVAEALIAALYLDGGLSAARAFVERHWAERMRAVESPRRDAKTRLQEWALGRGLPLPAYTMLERTGPDHAPTITVACEVEGLGRTTARGSSKRAAEQSAAEELLAAVERR